MTDLQVKFQTLQETKRANLANEAIKQQEADTKLKLTDAQIDEIKENINLIMARTDLTKTQKIESISKIVANFGGTMIDAMDLGRKIFDTASNFGLKASNALFDNTGKLLSGGYAMATRPVADTLDALVKVSKIGGKGNAIANLFAV